jgi:hypothetical protein
MDMIKFGYNQVTRLGTQATEHISKVGINTAKRLSDGANQVAEIVKEFFKGDFASFIQANIKYMTAVSDKPSLFESPVNFPERLKDINVISKLRSTTGAQKVEANGLTFIKKSQLGEKLGHVEAEYHGDLVYRSVGAKVPQKTIYYTTTSKTVKGTPGEIRPKNTCGVTTLSEFKENTVSLKDYLADGEIEDEKKQKTKDALCEHFVVDCILGNYDVIGFNSDNVLVDAEGEPWRIDNGSCFNYQAGGEIKEDKFWGREVSEIDNMRNPNFKFKQEIKNAGQIYQNVTDDQIKEQLNKILQNRNTFLAAIPKHHRDIVNQRIDYLKERFIK